jgi:hypothetical protein
MADDFERRVIETEHLLIDSCREWGITLAGDKSVTEPDAERLLGYKPGSLRKQRDEESCGITRRQIGNRWRYRLIDLAREFESNCENA